MAYDGIFIKSQIEEIKKVVLDEHVAKITMTSAKEVSFHVRKKGMNYILKMNANPNFPHILLDVDDTDNLKVPPAFCMLLRKYLQGAVIKNIYQVGKDADKNNFIDNGSYERIVKFSFENIDENGDVREFYIFFEIMGKYSNLIVTDDNYTILDTMIKGNTENERLKQKNTYTIDDIASRLELKEITFDEFKSLIEKEKTLTSINGEQYDAVNSICKIFAGISRPYVISELIKYSGTKNEADYYNYDILQRDINDIDKLEGFLKLLQKDIYSDVTPCINYKNDKPSDFYLYRLEQFVGKVEYFDNINSLISTYVNEKYSKINDSADKTDLNETVKKLYVKLNKKIDIYKKDLAKCDDLEKYKTYAELISAFGYDKNLIKDGELVCKDYNDGDREVRIPINESVSIAKNVEHYYSRYNKLKRTKENAAKLIDEANAKIEHLNSIESALEITSNKNDLYLIKEELKQYFDEAHSIGVLNQHKGNLKPKTKSKNQNKIEYNIHHYKSTSGVDIYVGKNNLQNEYLTFTFASPTDTWLHIKDATGSHVIIKKSYEHLDDKTLIEAASLAAYFSDRRNETKATVDYTLRKELKKVKGKPPGFCIYHKNYSINVKPEVLVKEI